MPENNDTDFSWEVFQSGVNKDLADVLGNFVSRVTKFCRSKWGEVVPSGGEYGPAEQALIAEIDTKIRSFETAMEAIEIRKSAAELRAIWVAGNEYLQAAEPWSVYKTDPDRAAAIIRFALNLIRLYAVLSEPFIPSASNTLKKVLHLDNLDWPESTGAALATLAEGHEFEVPEVLFAKISDERREELEARFAGS